MPDELKVDRSYHEALRRIGVKNPGEVRVGVPAQLTVQVDSLAHLMPPVGVAVAGGGSFWGAAAAVRAVTAEWEIRSPGGAWVLWASSVDQDARLCIFGATVITANAALIAPAFVSVPAGANALQSLLREGDTNVAQNLLEGVMVSEGSAFTIPTYVEMGRFVSLIGFNLNVNLTGSIVIQEVP